ncbi:MAG: bifunctional (p)ppGpp synthetase/guanosine-3',5'-bis(diphosphate) 3'-pyrophosphohydrolase [Firmicutes bacterium]|nr:bifunctional (p)ppGpp synthetase/guanosine-3',5'-bis(diphosphate) 3'-pyrophosphohydrolase [Bacillota bacterium]
MAHTKTQQQEGTMEAPCVHDGQGEGLQGKMDALMQKFATKFSGDQLERLQKAVAYAQQMHHAQKRDSGQPYFVHPLAVAEILFEMGLDVPTLCAGLLHDVLEDCDTTSEQMCALFGTEITTLVGGVTKLTSLGHIKHKNTQEESELQNEWHNRSSVIPGPKERVESTDTEILQAENIRKMLIAVAKDIRVLLIKLADRLHNMRTVSAIRKERQLKIAKETLDIFAPLASRLGLSYIKTELEDLCFKTMYPDDYEQLAIALNFTKKERVESIDTICNRIGSVLQAQGIVYEISGRPKHFYSIYKKMRKQQKPINEIYDLTAIRVIVNSVADCYAVLGSIHHEWQPLPHRIKDYISVPKANQYQSLHTTVMTPLGRPFEIQIRTADMHRVAEYGIAAHWLYKERRTATNDLDQKMSWIRDMLDAAGGDGAGPIEFLDALKQDLYTDQIFVFSPQGKVIVLPMGSCVLDFAYSVHSDVGNKCSGAKVNDKQVPIVTVLKSGDIVQIDTKNSNTPSRDWLRIVKSTQAKSKIKAYFKKEGREDNIKKGKEMLELESKHKGYSWSVLQSAKNLPSVLQRLGLSTQEDMYAAVGYGGVTTLQVLTKCIESYEKSQTETPPHHIESLNQELKKLKKPKQLASEEILIRGQAGLKVVVAKCCRPVKGDEIVGFISRGKGVAVHRNTCPNLKGEESYRLIEASWATYESEGEFVARLVVECDNADNVVFRLTGVVAETKVLLRGIQTVATPKPHIKMSVGVDSKDTLDLLIRKLENFSFVYKVYRE